VSAVTSLPQQHTGLAPAVRLSDHDREQAVARLNAAVAEGRLTWPEHAERVERAWAARTAADLTPCLHDLGVAAAPVAVEQPVTAVFSKIVRRPAPGHPIRARSLFGAVFLDLSDARPGEQCTVDASSFCGKVVLTVGADATVLDEGVAILGKRKVYASGAPGGPVVRITGRSVLGHLKVLAHGQRGW
jgi:hypothetical protein